MYKIIIAGCFFIFSVAALGQTPKLLTSKKQLFADTAIQFKHFDDVQVFQYFDNDSLSAVITHSQKLDSSGNVIAEYYTGYKTDKHNGLMDVLTFNEFNASGQRITSTDYYPTYQEGKAQLRYVEKTFFYYKDSLLIRSEQFDFTRREKPTKNREPVKFRGCHRTDIEYEEKESWQIKHISLFKYNKQGRRISYDLPLSSRQNKSEYEYNNDGQLSKEKLLDEYGLIYTVYYEYNGNKETSTLFWENESYGSTMTIKIYDKDNHLLKETNIRGDNAVTDEYQYDNNGRLVRFISYNSEGDTELTHIYKYQAVH